MAATTLSFSKVGNVWVATTDALGNMILQVKRNADGAIKIEQYIDGMDPMPCKDIINQDANLLIPFASAKGLKLKITSQVEVTKAMIIEAVFESTSSGGGLTTADIINVLTSDETDKALSAAQGKALKTLIDGKVIPTAATTAQAGLVKKMAAVAKPQDDTPANIKASLEQFIDAAKTALMME
jgi:hypothetical protein